MEPRDIVINTLAELQHHAFWSRPASRLDRFSTFITEMQAASRLRPKSEGLSNPRLVLGTEPPRKLDGAVWAAYCATPRKEGEPFASVFAVNGHYGIDEGHPPGK